MFDCTQKRVINSEKAPKAIGPYSPATSVNHFIFTSGQLGINPETGNIVEGGIEAETRQALLNLKNILEDAGTALEHVMKTTVFLKDINDFSKMNAVYAEFFTENFPARSAIQVAALPKGGMVEIEAVAVLAECEFCESLCDCDCDCDCEDGECDCGHKE